MEYQRIGEFEMKLIGTINKRIDVGYYPNENSFFIMSNSNCIRLFNESELNCMLAVFTILNTLPVDDAIEWFHKHRISLFEPAPPAEIRII